MVKTIFQKYKKIFGITILSFNRNNDTKLAGSLAYRAIFAFPPLLLLVIISGGYFYGDAAIQGKIFTQLNGFIGEKTATVVQDALLSLHFSKGGLMATIISIVALVISATSVFTEIQSSLNFIWGIRSKQKRGVIKVVLNRLLSFALIIGLGFLLIISLIADTIILALGKFFLTYLPQLPVSLISLLNLGFLFLVLLFSFCFMFKVLPDLKLRWKDVFPGALLTVLLFMGGKYLIGLYIGSSTMISIYGAASSIIIFLIWIYFSSMILYIGAEFSRAWVIYHGVNPQLSNFAEVDHRSVRVSYTESDKKGGNLNPPARK